MEWFRAVNSYCERTDASYWSEPLNAMSNMGFLVAAFVCWRMLGARGERGARLLVAVLCAIGIGSYLFHTHAQVWAGLADVLPILLFILIYIHLATVRFLRLPLWAGLAAAAAYLPASAVLSMGIRAAVGSLNGSVGYVPVVLLIAAFALLLRRRRPETARGLAIGAGLLALSLSFRSVDAALCPVWPYGTHFVWHGLNAAMLGWMVAVLVRDGADGGLARGARPE